MKILEFFSESNGQLSNTRLNASLCVYVALVIILVSTFKATPVPLEIVITLLTAGFGSKLIQKGLEEKPGS